MRIYIEDTDSQEWYEVSPDLVVNTYGIISFQTIFERLLVLKKSEESNPEWRAKIFSIPVPHLNRSPVKDELALRFLKFKQSLKE
jgi:hypothetical protein